MRKSAVIAIGGNSLIKDNQHQRVQDQLNCLKKTASYVADLIEMNYDLVITHGNGPQVGFGLIRSEAASTILPLNPMDACGAETQGLVGYMIQQSFYNEFLRRGIKKQVATVVTQVVIDQDDPAFDHPSKPVGPFYAYEKAQSLQKEKGWTIIEDAGRGYRRVVPSPIPQEIVEKGIINALLKKGYIVISVGGGGIPVIKNSSGRLEGIAAVIDKDYASSLLAREIQTDYFMIFTAVEKVYLNYGQKSQSALHVISTKEARKYLAAGHFASGSMAPKVRSAIEFTDKCGNDSIIGSLEKLKETMSGKSGTRIVSR